MDFKDFYINNVSYFVHNGYIITSLNDILLLIYLLLCIWLIVSLVIIFGIGASDDWTEKEIDKARMKPYIRYVIIICVSFLLLFTIQSVSTNYFVNQGGLEIVKQSKEITKQVNGSKILNLFNDYIKLKDKEILKDMEND